MTPTEEDKLCLAILRAVNDMVKGRAAPDYLQNVIRAAQLLPSKP